MTTKEIYAEVDIEPGIKVRVIYDLDLTKKNDPGSFAVWIKLKLEELQKGA